MSMISEQINGLRKLAKTLEEGGWNVDVLQLVNELRCSADTIEELSAKLASANMERSTAYYNDGWIPCSERLPKNYETVNITWANRNPVSYYAHIKDKPYTGTAIYFYGKWYWYSCVCEDYLKDCGDSTEDRMDKDIEVLAWQPLPKPYQPKGEK